MTKTTTNPTDAEREHNNLLVLIERLERQGCSEAEIVRAVRDARSGAESNRSPLDRIRALLEAA
jgi:hypothetical protein